MMSLVYIALATLLLADDLHKLSALPAGQWYNCDGLETQEQCTATRWCVWTKNIAAASACVYDKCLTYITKEQLDSETPPTCPTGDVTCKMFYVTDTHNCQTGEASGYDDVYCRTSSDAHEKLPVDPCFFQDLKSRFTNDGNHACANIGGVASCSGVSNGSDNYYCAEKGKSCNEYFDDVDDAGVPTDRAGFCDCLGPKYCYLYPYCSLNRTSDSQCLADPCGYATVYNGQPFGSGINLAACNLVNAVKATGGTSTAPISIIVSNSTSSVVKANDWNQCYFGIQSRVTYVNNAFKFPECASVVEDNACGSLKTSSTSDEYCVVKPIAANYFLPAVSNYCTDGAANHEPPSPEGSSSIVRVPALLALLLLAVVFIL